MDTKGGVLARMRTRNMYRRHGVRLHGAKSYKSESESDPPSGPSLALALARSLGHVVRLHERRQSSTLLQACHGRHGHRERGHGNPVQGWEDRKGGYPGPF